jgi:putative glutamine amidotransferase
MGAAGAYAGSSVAEPVPWRLRVRAGTVVTGNLVRRRVAAVRAPDEVHSASRSGRPVRVTEARRPRVGICAALEHARWAVWDREAVLLARSYIDAIQAAGAVALMIPPDAWVERHPDDVLDGLDGLILAGGADVDPSAYGAERDPATGRTRPERDRAEIALALRALELDMPLLGICRGMQMLNVALGGTLIQDLPGDAHRRVPGSFDGNDHDVRLEAGSLAARAAGELIHSSKSHHHQAVDRLGEGLVASGWSVEDGIVEAIELPRRRWALGVQWHPEGDPRSSVIGAFVAESAAVVSGR